jgi:glycine reductase
VYLVLSQGLLHDTWIEGRNAAEGLPRLVTPTFTLDDTVISGNCVSACDKNTTWHHQNNPVLLELLRHHGRDLNLAGVVLTNSPVRLHDKQAAADAAVAIARSLEVAGAIISKEGFGNPDADQMMLIRGLEAAGIATVAITDEFAGVNGASQSLADSAVEANAVVSTGNANELVELPAMDRVLGPADEVTTLAGASAESARADGSLLVELQTIVGATNGLGQGRLRAAGV